MKNIYLQIIDELAKGNALVLGMLIRTSGSTPQVPGASALFNINGLLCGTLGGGILEAEAQRLALKVIRTKENLYEEFSLNASINDEAGAICGGSAFFLLDANPAGSRRAFEQLKQSLEQNVPGLIFTVIHSGEGESVAVQRYWMEENAHIPEELSQNFKLGWGELDQILGERTPKVFEAKITTGERLDSLVFVEPVYPKPRLVIVGAGHIGQALCHQAHLLDFDVTILDNRSEMKAVCPDASEVIIDEIGSGFEQISITKDTYLVIVTPGHQHDAEALKCCIKSDAAYIGMIGSRRKIQLMRENFIRNGWATEWEFDRICAPIGLEIHSKTVQEIALSIAAQLVQVRHLKKLKKTLPSVWCIVLAAGESKRMKQQKLLMPYGGKSMIEIVVEKARRSKAENVLVVLGSDRERIEQKVLPLRPLIAENRDYREGMLSSVQCGIAAVPEGVDAAIILLGDQPMVRTEVIDELIEAFRRGNKGILMPIFQGKRGHPVLIDLRYREEINQLDPEKGLRELVYNHPEDIQEIEVESGDVLRDIDTPENYMKERK